MTPADPVKALIDQFSYTGQQGAIWKGFDRFLDTDRYLNLGYSSRFQTHLIGSPQRRLVAQVAMELTRGGVAPGDRLVDLGCGRGGPTLDLATELEVEAIGIDLVPYNLHFARINTYDALATPRFIQGDISHLPIRDGVAEAVTAIDSLVYIDRTERVMAELARILDPEATAVITDLMLGDAGDVETATLERFEDAWGLAAIVDIETYRAGIEASGLHIDAWTDLTPYSVGQFRAWTSRYLTLRAGHTSSLIERTFDRLDLDIDAIDEQVEAAHDILPHLRHVMVRSRIRGD